MKLGFMPVKLVALRLLNKTLGGVQKSGEVFNEVKGMADAVISKVPHPITNFDPVAQTSFREISSYQCYLLVAVI